MAEYDILVLGGGTGNIVAAAAASEGQDVALVEAGQLGGTCLNRGCNPSKKLIRRANVAETIRNAESLGIDAPIDEIAFGEIVDEVTSTIDRAAAAKTERARDDENVTLYQSEGRFVDNRTVEVGGTGENGDPVVSSGGEHLTADRIVLAGGSRPLIPSSIDGVQDVEFLTNEEALRLRDRPDRLVIVGGGYIAVEMAHFFGQLGTDVVIVGHGTALVDREDEEIAHRLTDAYREKHELHLGFEATAIAADGTEKTVRAESDDGEEIEVTGDELLIATGRKPNSDRWNVSAAGIETNEKGFVETDEYLQTTAKGIWAIGDIAGNYMFKHSGDKEAKYVVENAVRGNDREVEYPGMAHAVFGSPQVGSLGKTEREIDDGVEYETGTYAYEDQALGATLNDDDGFAKAIVGADGEILGCHIIGPDASTLIHEVSTAVAAGADAETIAETIHIHPALSEVVQGAFREVCDVAPTGI
ncbi:dihydrolipoyl dehydrogenase family protein [Haloarcula nitratireducens]|uniref:Dihydrolipoyl dehydrogenase n=1 Tax=Haloarcula nitratireducens TaxID=2487749 RepID=A0AAW4PHE5_9EURY|nr:dihydrolipoyl dehydrogenase [Halomicroarcula nitratireducens]MBX0297450.1 dihydrolipoyl dehydrogenase [Halomicroarcula nitratireducens]